jgi:hypothetical protein
MTVSLESQRQPNDNRQPRSVTLREWSVSGVHQHELAGHPLTPIKKVRSSPR